MATSPVLENLGIQIRDLIENILANSFILDYGVVQAVSMNANNVTTVDVAHSIQLNKLGTVIDSTITKNVEVMWYSSAGLSTKGKIAQGDPVLLVGLKDYLASIASPSPAATDVPVHYNRQTLKAIAMGPYASGSTHTIDASGSTMLIDGGSNGAARTGDAIVINATTDPVNIGILTSALGITSLTGKISGGSSKVNIG
jgi:hypothetical protein